MNPDAHALDGQQTPSTHVSPVLHATPAPQVAPAPAGGLHAPEATSHVSPVRQSVGAMHVVLHAEVLAHWYCPHVEGVVMHVPVPLQVSVPSETLLPLPEQVIVLQPVTGALGAWQAVESTPLQE